MVVLWFCGVHIYFVHLAGCASFDILCNVVAHAGPPVVLANCVGCFQNSRVSSRERVMKKCYHPPTKVIVCHNNKGIILPPEVVPLFHIVSHMPGIQLGMVLWLGLHMQDLSFGVMIQDVVINV